MDLLHYTTYDEIRSLLGVTPKELKDEVIALPHWTLAVEQELLDIDGGTGLVLSQYDQIYALDEASRTPSQTQFFKVTSMFVLYAMGLQLLNSADSFSPVQISDGKATVERLKERFEKMGPAIEAGLRKLEQRVKDALGVLQPTAPLPAAVERVMIIGTGLATDPVTGV